MHAQKWGLLRLLAREKPPESQRVHRALGVERD
jgi:hypothetical protein